MALGFPKESFKSKRNLNYYCEIFWPKPGKKTGEIALPKCLSELNVYFPKNADSEDKTNQSGGTIGELAFKVSLENDSYEDLVHDFNKLKLHDFFSNHGGK